MVCKTLRLQRTENMSEDGIKSLEEKLKQFEDDKNEQYPDTSGTVTKLPIQDNRKRNLVFDEERFEETFLKCMICRENFDEDEKLPKMLPCHHTFCLDCLKQMFRVEGEFRQTLTSAFRSMPVAVKICCPTCRDGLITSEAEICRLPNDHTVLELLCFVKLTSKSDIQYCTKHKMQPLNFFCEPCIIPVCCDCTVLDHKESRGHVVMNVDEALQKYAPVLEETMTEMKNEEKGLEEKKIALEKAAENIEQIQKELAVQIRNTFDRMRDAIDDRERALFEISETEIEKKRAEIRDQLKAVSNREKALQNEKDGLEAARNDRNIKAMFTNHQSARQTLGKKVFIPGPSKSAKDFAVSFQFNSRQENNVRQTISGFGDVTFKLT